MTTQKGAQKLQLALEDISDEWRKLIVSDELNVIFDQLDANATPPSKHIFLWARVTPLRSVKVVIIAQDPYSDGSADGLAFSGKNSGSAANIIKALQKSNLIDEPPQKFMLDSWAHQGILLLNKSLTTEFGRPNAHAKIWGDYMQNFINRLEEARGELIFVLWGQEAQKISCSGRRLEYWHPSPNNTQGFADCPHFSEISSIYPEISWRIEIDQINIYTDGSCYPNDSSPEAKGGYAVVMPALQIIILGKIKCGATNIRAEGMAIIEAMKYFYNKNLHFHVVLHTDSQFWIDMILKWLPSWSAAKIAESKNPDLTKLIKKCWKLMHNYFELKHVYSHGKKNTRNTEHGDWNAVADKAANWARMYLNSEREIVSINKFV